MGVISILLGIIEFLVFTGAGIFLAKTLLDYKTLLSASIIVLRDISNVAFVAIIIGVFVFMGLMISMKLIMLGVNHNKLSKILRRMKRKI